MLRAARSAAATADRAAEKAQGSYASAEADVRSISTLGVVSAFKRTPAQQAGDSAVVTALLVQAAKARVAADNAVVGTRERVRALDNDSGRGAINDRAVKRAKQAELHAEVAERSWWQQLDLDRRRAKVESHQDTRGAPDRFSWLNVVTNLSKRIETDMSACKGPK